MKLLYMLSLASLLLAPAMGQGQASSKSGAVKLTAEKLARTGDVVHASGHALATVAGITVAADEATLHSDTGELEMRGGVHAILPERTDHSLFRYANGSLVTDQPVGLNADRLTIKNGLLEASGSVAVLPTDPDMRGAQLHGDDLSMKLETADATLRGNVRTVKIPGNAPSRFDPRLQRIFPPEIVK